MQPSEISHVLNRPISQELFARDITRLAYVAKDGTPRTVPIGFTWNGTEIVMCTPTNAAKIPALRRNPAVALGEADRLRDDPSERGRGADPEAGRTPAGVSTPDGVPSTLSGGRKE